MTKLVVEVQDLHGRNKNYYLVDDFPLTIGRGYSNDIIIADPHVCAEHLQINPQQQGWLVIDQGSNNGIHSDVDGGNQRETVIQSGDEIVIGKTRLKFYQPDHPVSPTKALHGSGNVIEAIKSAAVIWALLSMLVIGFALNDYMASSMDISIEKYIAGTFPVVALVLVWSAVWSLLTYIVRRRTYFYYFLTVSVLYVLADILFEIIISIIAFNVATDWLSEVLSYITGGIMLAVLFYACMYHAFAISIRRRLLLANAFSWGLIMIVIFVVYSNRPDFVRNPEYPAELKPPFARIVSADSLEHFLASSEQLLEQLDD